MYTDHNRVLRHRCECVTSVTGVNTKRPMARHTAQKQETLTVKKLMEKSIITELSTYTELYACSKTPFAGPTIGYDCDDRKLNLCEKVKAIWDTRTHTGRDQKSVL